MCQVAAPGRAVGQRRAAGGPPQRRGAPVHQLSGFLGPHPGTRRRNHRVIAVSPHPGPGGLRDKRGVRTSRRMPHSSTRSRGARSRDQRTGGTIV